MARFSDKKIGKPKQDELWDEFCDLVVKLKTRESVRRFFCDLLNRPERLMLARRLQIAALLESNMSYYEIKKTLRVGGTTIARVHRWLEFGRGGYKNVVKHISVRDPASLKRKYASFYR